MKRVAYKFPLFFVALCGALLNYTEAEGQFNKREFRGVWIASVANIDWPSKPGLSTADQQREFITILDRHKSIGINAVIVQVRPCADAFYNSPHEPWSKWLTGKSGLYPYPYYDPLEFMISESHKRGLEFHAWFNPYRALINFEETGIDSASLVFKNPEWFVPYGKNMYFDPGLPEARAHTTKVILDVVKRYDIDGVHFDDYFYPYRISKIEFPDSASFNQYGGEFSHRDDWRRNNVDVLIKSLSDSIRNLKPHVQFGISPFGIWRNKSADPDGSDTKGGQTCYDDLYADVLKWLREGWIDYVVPQLYWHIGHPAAPYEVLVNWWNEKSFNRKLYIGHGAYRAGNQNDSIWKNSDPIVAQLHMNAELNNISGSIFFSSKSLTNDNGNIATRLKASFYKYPAITPEVHSAAEKTNTDYELSFIPRKNGLQLFWNEQAQDLSAHSRYVVYRFQRNEEIDLNNPSKIMAILPNTNPEHGTRQTFIDETTQVRKKYTYIITSVNRFNSESEPAHGYPVKVLRKYWRSYPPIDIN